MRGFDHSLLERQILERVQSVVVNENADRTLHREQVRRVFNTPAQFIQPRLIVAIAPQTATVGRFVVRILRWKDRWSVEFTASRIGHTYSTFRSANARDPLRCGIGSPTALVTSGNSFLWRSRLTNFFQHSYRVAELRVKIAPQNIEHLNQGWIAERIENLVTSLAVDQDVFSPQDRQML